MTGTRNRSTILRQAGVACAALALLAGCRPGNSGKAADGRLPVFAGIPPVVFLAEQIGGQYVTVGTLVRPGQDPHTFEPTPQQVLALSRAAVFFKVGMAFENTVVAKVLESNPRLVVVDTTEGVEKRAIDEPSSSAGEGAAHPGHEAIEGEPDPHVWLSPPLLKTLAANIAAGLCRADPRHAEAYRQNLAGLLRRIDALHERLGRMLAPYRGRSFIVFHPGFGYFADAYGLREEAVQRGGREPTPKQLRALIQRAKAQGIKTVFVQPEFDRHAAEVFARAIGGKVLPMNGLAQDVLADLEDIGAKVQKSFEE
jgi:zinc transport system substrate-binding protein